MIYIYKHLCTHPEISHELLSVLHRCSLVQQKLPQLLHGLYKDRVPVTVLEREEKKRNFNCHKHKQL